MPPQQASCVAAMGACPAPPTTRGSVDGTAAILAQFYEMSIREDYEVEDTSAKGTASQNMALDCSSEDKDVASITSAVQSISLASSTAVLYAEEAAASHVPSLDAERVSSSKDVQDAESTSSSKNIEDAESTASSKDIKDAKSVSSRKDAHDAESTASSKDVQDAESTSSTKDIHDAESVSYRKDAHDAESVSSTKDGQETEGSVTSSRAEGLVNDTKSHPKNKATTDEDLDDDKNSKHTEGSEHDDTSSSEEKEGKGDEKEVSKKKKLISRGLKHNRTQVYSRDRQTGGLVFTYTPVQDTSLALPAQQWWTDYREPQHFYCEVNNVDSSSGSGDQQLDMDPGFLLEDASSLTLLQGDDVEKFLDELNNSEEKQSVEMEDEGLPPSPESLGSVSSPSYSNHSSMTSGLGSPCGSMSTMSPECSSQPPSPAQVYTPSTSPPQHKPIRPKARPAREIILERISKDEKQEACLKINLASEEKLMRSGDPDGDTNLTVLVRFWERHNRPIALLYAIVERMKFIENGLSKKTLKGENALRLAAMFAHADPLVARYIAEVMVEREEDINEVDGNGSTVIHNLCWNGDSHIHVLEELLSVNKFDVNRANHYGVTPLRVACSKGAVQMVAVLLDSGAQLDQSTSGASSRGEPLVLLSPDQLQEVERLYKEQAWRRHAH